MKRIQQFKKVFKLYHRQGYDVSDRWVEFLKRNKYIVEIEGNLKL
jgi:hypothetical protein